MLSQPHPFPTLSRTSPSHSPTWVMAWSSITSFLSLFLAPECSPSARFSPKVYQLFKIHKLNVTSSSTRPFSLCWLTRWPNLLNSHVYTFCLNHPFEEVIPCCPVCFLIPSCLPYQNDSPWQAETCLSCHLFSTKPRAVHTVGTPEILLNK